MKIIHFILFTTVIGDCTHQENLSNKMHVTKRPFLQGHLYNYNDLSFDTWGIY
jgi:hypothetical protein